MIDFRYLRGLYWPLLTSNALKWPVRVKTEKGREATAFPGLSKRAYFSSTLKCRLKTIEKVTTKHEFNHGYNHMNHWKVIQWSHQIQQNQKVRQVLQNTPDRMELMGTQTDSAPSVSPEMTQYLYQLKL